MSCTLSLHVLLHTENKAQRMSRPLRKKYHKPMEFTSNRQELKLVYFAVSTTGFPGQDGDICEIAAKYDGCESPWHVYVCPDKEFVPQASSYNGFRKNVDHGGLTHDGVGVETLTISQALETFIKYVSGIAGSEHTTVLVGWNSQQFHIPILLKELKKCKLSYSALEDAGVCYGDPLLMIKKNPASFPQIAQSPSRHLPDVYQHLNQGVVCPNTFNAYRIVDILQSVMSSLRVTNEQLRDYSFTLSSADRVRKYRHIVKRNLRSLEDKLYTRQRPQIAGYRGVISKSMAAKIAESGLDYRHLRRIYCKRGREGLERILKAPLPQRDGASRAKPRVTRNKKVIDAIVKYFEDRAARRRRHKTN